MGTLKRFWIVGLVLLASSLAGAQQFRTVVSAQVKDINNSLYVNCQYSVDFVPFATTPGPYSYGGNINFQTSYTGVRCDSSGNLSISLPDNLLGISPTDGKWRFSICSAQGYVGGPYCFQYALQITGATQNITSALQAVAPILPITNNKLRCETGLGDGLNAITGGTYLQSFCYNDSGLPWTINGIRCFTDNSGTSTLNATDGSNNALLTGAITCTSGFAAGTQSGTVTIASGGFVKFTFVGDGTSKQTTWVVSLTQ